MSRSVVMKQIVSEETRWQIVAQLDGPQVRFLVEKWVEGQWLACDQDGHAGLEPYCFGELAVPPSTPEKLEDILINGVVPRVERMRDQDTAERKLAEWLHELAAQLGHIES